MDELIARLESNVPLPICPYDPLSPEYWTAPDDEPCKFCGQENTMEGSDKCRGADTRLFKDAAAALRAAAERELVLREALNGVIRVADRDCPEFRAARAALKEEKP